MRKLLWTFVAFAWSNLAFSQPPQVVDVTAFGAKGDGATDDTRAIQAAADDAAARTVALQPPGGAYLGSSPPVYFPAGRYKISDEINFSGYANVLSDAKAIVEQTADCRTFVFGNGYTVSVSGIRFLGGTQQIYYANANVDASTLDIEKCEFQLSKDFAVYTTGTTDGHLSAKLVIDKCRFILPRQVLHNACDVATVRDCWVYIGERNFAAESAAFVNYSGALLFDNMFGVPSFGDAKNHRAVRWVDNYGYQFVAARSRFGGEYGGIPVVYHFGKAGTEYPWMGQAVVITDSIVSAGRSSNPHAGVVTLRGGVPKVIRIEANLHVVDVPYIRVDGLDLDAYLKSRENSPQHQIVIKSNMAIPSSPEIPPQLEQFMERDAKKP